MCFILYLDSQQDEEIDLIGQGVDELRELALTANEEVKLQNRMLEGLEQKMEKTAEKVIGVNEQLKATLDKARKSDKICMVGVCCYCMHSVTFVFRT